MLLGTAPAVAETPPDYDCKAGAVIIVGGTNDPDGRFLVGVTERYTGRKPIIDPDGNLQIVDDPASPYRGDGAFTILYADYATTLWPLGSPGYDEDVARGVASTEQLIADYQSHCGGKTVVVAGYSQGARVAGDVLSDLGNGRTTTVAAADGTPVTIDTSTLRGELYSDPRRDGDRGGRGVELSLVGVIPGLTMSGAREGGFGTIPVVSFCVRGDGICDVPDPLHDPFGAIDAFVGYFNRHGYYPTRMWAPATNSNVWRCTQTPTADDVRTGYVDCFVPAQSPISQLRQDTINGVRGVFGLAPREVVDFWNKLPNFNRVFPYANLADLQRFVAPVMNVFPPLPSLGYGAYLPDLFMFTDVLGGIVTFDGARIMQGLGGLWGSATSIVLWPVNATKYWVNRIGSGVTGLASSPVGFSAAAGDEEGDGDVEGADAAMLDAGRPEPVVGASRNAVPGEREQWVPGRRAPERPVFVIGTQPRSGHRGNRTGEVPGAGQPETGQLTTGQPTAGQSAEPADLPDAAERGGTGGELDVELAS